MTEQATPLWAVEAHEHSLAMFGAERLSAEETNRLLGSRSARLIMAMGERGAGRSTLWAELYERQRHPGTGVSFAGSWTLLAFEALAQRLRDPSLPPLPAPHEHEDRDTLHLALSAGETPTHLLFVDLPGECFRRLADNQVSADDVPWLRRADKLILTVDGARLCDPDARAMVLARAHQLLERLATAGLPAEGGQLALLLTKWDLLWHDRAALDYWEPREAALLDEVRALDPTAPSLRTAATGDRACNDGFGHLRRWLLDIEGPAQPRELPPEPPAEEPVLRLLERPPDAPARRRRLRWGTRR